MAEQQNPARIVVIEDNPADVHLLRLALEEHGEAYQLELLPDGEAALRYIEAHCGTPGAQHDPCLIVLDLHLPRYDGAAVLQAIRRQPSLASVRVAVLTTQASPKEEAEVRALGVRLYRRKPLSWDEFAGLAAELIDLCNEPVTHAAASSL